MIPNSLPALGTSMANHLWQSTLFAVLAAMLTLALRKNQAQVRYRLWLAASLKFLLPFSLLISLGNHLARLNRPQETQPGFYFVMQKVTQPFNQAPGSRGLFAGSLLPLLPGIIAAVWLGGFMTAVGLCCLRWRRVIAAIRGAAPLSQGREVEALRNLERVAGMRRPIALWLSHSSLEPGIVGIVQPRLLWPAGISEHLQAILAHEVQHVRRRDNLAAAMHMVVEAIFWFHPLVWWLGARLVEEREWACDEEVLRLGNQPQVYAESILKTCKFCVESPLACISGVTGADLKKRIVRIMTERSTGKLSFLRKLLLTAIGIGAVAGPIVVGLMKVPLATAQSPQANAGSQPSTVDGDKHFPDTPMQKPSIVAALPQIYRVGDGVSAPALIFAPDPKFSDQALRAKYQGVCVVWLIVDVRGNPQHVQVVRSLGMGLDEKAIEAVEQYKFKPATLYGKPVAVEVHVEVNFRRYR